MSSLIIDKQNRIYRLPDGHTIRFKDAEQIRQGIWKHLHKPYLVIHPGSLSHFHDFQRAVTSLQSSGEVCPLALWTKLHECGLDSQTVVTAKLSTGHVIKFNVSEGA